MARLTELVRRRSHQAKRASLSPAVACRCSKIRPPDEVKALIHRASLVSWGSDHWRAALCKSHGFYLDPGSGLVPHQNDPDSHRSGATPWPEISFARGFPSNGHPRCIGPFDQPLNFPQKSWCIPSLYEVAQFWSPPGLQPQSLPFPWGSVFPPSTGVFKRGTEAVAKSAPPGQWLRSWTFEAMQGAASAEQVQSLMQFAQAGEFARNSRSSRGVGGVGGWGGGLLSHRGGGSFSVFALGCLRTLSNFKGVLRTNFFMARFLSKSHTSLR